MEDAPPDQSLDLSPIATRVEEVCLNAWPALQEIHYDGWLIRLADGQTRRVNSVNVIGTSTLPIGEKIAYCESVYRRHNLPACFRLLSTTASTLGASLALHGYRSEGETRTLFMNFAECPPAEGADDVELTGGVPTSEWMSARARFVGLRPGERTKIEKILQQLALPAIFVAVRENGVIRSLAKGAVHDGIVCLNMVATDPAHLRRGFSRSCLGAILNWAVDEHGARGACLQVETNNASGIRLYQSLGFAHELYRYDYRVREVCS